MTQFRLTVEEAKKPHDFGLGGLHEKMDEIMESVATVDQISDAVGQLEEAATNLAGGTNEAAVETLAVAFEALLSSHSLDSLHRATYKPAMESHGQKLQTLTQAMRDTRGRLALANEAFFEDTIKWFNTLGESQKDKMEDVAFKAKALLVEVQALDKDRGSEKTFPCTMTSRIAVNGDCSPHAINFGYENTIDLIKKLNTEYPVFFRELCREVVALYVQTSSLVTGVATVLVGISFIEYVIRLALGLALAITMAPGLLVPILALTAVRATIGDFIDGLMRWLLEKIPNERREEMKSIIERSKKSLQSIMEDFLSDFAKSGVNGNRAFVIQMDGKKPLLHLAKLDGVKNPQLIMVPTKREMVTILKTIIDGAEHYTSPAKATAMVNHTIAETEREFHVEGSKHSMTTDTLSFDKQAVRQASTSLYFKTEGLYRRPMSDLCKLQVESANALMTYIREAMRYYR